VREILPARRQSETIKFSHAGRRFIASIGYYSDGRPGEIFLVSGKSGSDSDIAVRDLGIATSLALQHGCSIDTLRHACLIADLDGRHEGPLGTLLDILIKGAK